MIITYIAETSITNKSAYTHHVLKMCDALSNKGKVTILLPYIQNSLKYRQLKKIFLFTSKRKFNLVSVLKFKINNFFARILFGYKVAKYIKKNKPELVITRSLISSFFLSLFEQKHFLEIHSELSGLTNFLMIKLNFINKSNIKKIILISKALKKKFPSVDKNKILILHDAVDLKNFRYKAGSKKIKIATYVGSFHKGKGVEIILKIANKFKNLRFNIYGDNKKKIENVPKNVKIFGYIKYNKVPQILKKSDLLLLPSADIQYGRSKSVNISNYNSPLKMFDYLASGRIILSSKRDGICEILKHNFNSIIVREYNLLEWEKSINAVLENKYNLTKLKKNSLITAKNYTWEKRVEKIMNVNF